MRGCIMAKQVKTVFITGAGSGIGLATARRFLRAGWNVVALEAVLRLLRQAEKSLRLAAFTILV